MFQKPFALKKHFEKKVYEDKTHGLLLVGHDQHFSNVAAFSTQSAVLPKTELMLNFSDKNIRSNF